MKDDPGEVGRGDAVLARVGEAGGWTAPCTTFGVMFKKDLNPT